MKFWSLRLISILCISFLFSCGKDDLYPKKFQKTRFEEGNTRLFASGGEVVNPEKINKFIERISSEFSILNVSPTLDSNIISYNEANFSVELISPSKARFIMDNGKILDYKIMHEKGIILFVKDSIVSTMGAFNEVWFRFKPYIDRVEPIPFGQMTYYKPTIYAYEIDGEIQIPILSFMAHYNYGCTFYLRENNSISSDLLGKISAASNPRDTIVFRESRIVFSEY